jgi:hypothetical protein
MMRLNKLGYQQLIDEDIAWLEKMPRTLERDHIIVVLRASIEHEYPSRRFTMEDLYPDSLCDEKCGPDCTSDHK